LPGPSKQRSGRLGRTTEVALRNVNQIMHMIAQEFIKEGRPLPQEEPRIAVTA